MTKQIKLYGEIWSWSERNSAGAFVERLSALENDASVTEIALHIHSNGGEVTEGVAIMTAIQACSKPVDAYIDGVCASMATQIMLACRNIYMAHNAYIMIHSPRGGAYGVADTLRNIADTLEGMTSNFLREYATRTGKTESDVKKWLDGNDHWFTAEQAQAEGLINGIVNPVDTKAAALNADELADITPEKLTHRFAALTYESTPPAGENITNQIKMDKQAMINRFGLTGVTAESSDDEIFAAIEKKNNDEKAAAEQALQAERDRQITALINASPVAKNFDDEKKAKLISIGQKAGIEALQLAVDNMKPQQAATITGQMNNNGGANAQQPTDPQTFAELVALGEETLADWRANRPADYAALYKKEFGQAPNFK